MSAPRCEQCHESAYLTLVGYERTETRNRQQFECRACGAITWGSWRDNAPRKVNA